MNSNHLNLEARLQNLQQQIQYSLSLFNAAASEIEHVRQDVKRAAGQSSAHAVLPVQQLADPYQQLRGSFQPRSPTGNWLSLTSSRQLFDGDDRGGNGTHLDGVPLQQDTACTFTDTRSPGLPDAQRNGSPLQGFNDTAAQHAVTWQQGHRVSQHMCAAEQQRSSPAARSQQPSGKAAAANATPEEFEVKLRSGDHVQQAERSHSPPAVASQHAPDQQEQLPQQRMSPAEYLQSSPELSASIPPAETDSRQPESQSTANSSGVSVQQPTVAPDPARGDHLGPSALEAAGMERDTSDQDVAGPEDTHTGMFRVPLPGEALRILASVSSSVVQNRSCIKSSAGSVIGRCSVDCCYQVLW